MMYKIKYRTVIAILSLTISSLLISCTSNTAASTEGDTTDNNETVVIEADMKDIAEGGTTEVSTNVQSQNVYPSVSKEKMEYLWENCDYVDYIFYDLPFSLSLDNQPSIRKFLRHVSTKPAIERPNCPAVGRIFFQEKGENIAEVDIHYSLSDNACAYFVFHEDGKPTYGNYMTPEGAQFMNNTVQSKGQGGN